MTDYSWLEPMERRTREIREETQRIKDETEKMRQKTHNLPVPDDAPWLNLSQEEVEELRNKKFELTEYGKQRLREMLSHEEMLEKAERRERSNRILERYNHFYNLECSGLSHGTPITPEFQQAMALECMLDTLRCENLNHEFSEVQTADINALIEGLYQQGRDYLERVKTLQQPSQGHSKTDLDAL